LRKRILKTLLSSAVLAVLLPTTAFAASAGTEGISGIVTNNGNLAVGAQVIVICDSNTKKTKTDSSGAYLVQYKTTQCPNGATAHVTANYEGNSGNSSAEIKSENLILAEKLNASDIPRYSLVIGGSASILGGIGYSLMRRSEYGTHLNC
jgi:hypothetical protein